MRNLARSVRDAGALFPAVYQRFFRRQFAFGCPAFAVALSVLWLMLSKPDLG
ncbi:DUF2269 family protein [Primorskyibacter aestuariivivens]|uniref:DUF2269 family protein n=1 Tax=Primorskyibacter aestuariivivens TaxID=1888912 RepID=UPI002301EB4C|nr:DUF2269 family protein [Primorskyibacter aestuariivivens]MDA7427515.1 DUF2269 family protein [Primorskyibacter aestuariivivens]